MEERKMPTYDYICEACSHEFEEFQQISDKTLVACPKCKKRKLRRKIGAGAAVLFKGSGFYQTDYRSKSYSSQAKADVAPAACASSSSPACSSCPHAKKD